MRAPRESISLRVRQPSFAGDSSVGRLAVRLFAGERAVRQPERGRAAEVARVTAHRLADETLAAAVAVARAALALAFAGLADATHDCSSEKADRHHQNRHLAKHAALPRYGPRPLGGHA